MAFSNNMTKLLTKIENRLGVKLLNLPEELCKDKWATEVIIPDTLATFSRFFPNQIEYHVDQTHPKKNGYYYIDEKYIEGVEILGVRDLSWSNFGDDSLIYQQNMGYGAIDYVSRSAGMGIEDVAMAQMGADFSSLFSNNIYVDFIPPNKFALKGFGNNDFGKSIRRFTILLLIKHSDNLTTISPTKMEIFENLAIADVASFLYNNLKFYDGLETVFARIDLKLEDLRSKSEQREVIIDKLENSYVSASNDYAPMILTI